MQHNRGLSPLRMWRALLMAFSAVLLTATAFAEDAFVPIVSAFAPQPVHYDTSWRSTLTITNPTDVGLTFRHVRVFGDRAYIAPFCAGSFSVPPQSSLRIQDIGEPECVHPGSGVAFLQLDLDPGLIVTSGIHLTEALGCNDSPGSAFISIAASALPVHTAPFSQGATAVSADLAMPRTLFGGHILELCDGPRYAGRRINVTIVNLGPAAAVATIIAAGTTIAPYTTTVAANSVVQLNNVFPEANCEVLLVSATQPYLCYASSVVTWTDSSLPPSVAVYTFRPLP